MEPINHTQWTQFKTAALWIWAAVQLIWKALIWCVRTTLVIAVGALYFTRQAVYGTLSFIMPADRFDRMGNEISDAVTDGLASIEIDEEEEDEGRWEDDERPRYTIDLDGTTWVRF